MLGENCTSTCRTKDHETWGACMRAKKIKIGYCKSHLGQDYTRQKQWDAELAEYKAAHDAGIRPDGTTTAKTRFAVEQSEKAGMRYGAEMYVMPDMEGKSGRDGKKKYNYVSYKEYEAAVAETTTEDTRAIIDTAKAIKEGKG